MDYSVCRLSYKEYVFYYVKGTLIIVFISYLFYKNLFVSLMLVPFSYVYVREKKKQLVEERKRQLAMEFKECIASVASALNAGYSVENSFYEAYMELQTVLGEDAYILQELSEMLKGFQNNTTIEAYLTEFAERSGIEDICDFIQVLVTAKRTGGNMIGIIKRTARNMNDKMEVENEIKMLLAAKNYEARIMNAVPLGVILYMWVFSPGFLEPLYHNAAGAIIMTIMLLVYIGSFCLTKKIVNICI